MHNLDLEAIRCVERFDADFQLQRMEACRKAWPHAGVEIRGFGDATAIRVKAEFPQKNVVVRFDSSQLSQLPELLRFFKEVKRGFVFTLPYGTLDDETFDVLSLAGMRCDESGHVLAIRPCPTEPSPKIVVRASPPDEEELYLDLYRRSFSTQRVVTEEQVRFQWLNDSLAGAQRFIGELDGEPVGMAALNVIEDGAYLSTAGVLPSFRGRGVHQAMALARVNAAYEANCSVAFGGGAIFGQPMKNLAQCGFTLLPLGVSWYIPVSQLSLR